MNEFDRLKSQVAHLYLYPQRNPNHLMGPRTNQSLVVPVKVHAIQERYLEFKVTVYIIFIVLLIVLRILCLKSQNKEILEQAGFERNTEADMCTVIYNLFLC